MTVHLSESYYSEQEIELVEMDRQLAEKERKLAERRIATMMSQIRSHFIFNILTATVTDNGAGFAPEECDKEDSVGIRNVRFRLESMIHGSHTVESSPGEWTKVTIRIPAK